ncbi:MAG: 50S ribosomal protein L17 [Candidatus Stahlbacteria bacterium]|nr:MAG: 50S ribosomal protein L17 [Candidatus Stahlbacteria bacterium]
MRHRKDLSKLGRPRAHRKALVKSLVRSLFLYESIKTTLTKAKAAQRLAERLVSRSRRDDLAARRYAYVHLGDHELVARLFGEISPRFEDRASGFTRIFMLGSRPGDGAQMAVLEMAVKGETKKAKKTKQATKTAAKSPAGKIGKSKTKPKAKAKSPKKEAGKERKPAAAKKKPTSKQKSG